MVNRRRSVVAFFLLGVAALVPLALHAQAVPRDIIASVLDATGAPVMDVGPSDLVVREDDVAREILRVTPADSPMQIALLVDNSVASQPYINEYRVALPGFISEILGHEPTGGRHQIAIVGVAARPTILHDYSSNEADVLKAAERIFAQTDAASYVLDAIVEISQGIARRSATRPVIVAVTAEGPDYSRRNYQEVLEALSETGAALHVVSLGDPSDQGHDWNVALNRGPRDSGGGTHTLLAARALGDRLKQVAVELTHQHRVTYAQPQTLIPPDRITIAGSRPELTVRGSVISDEPRRGPR